MELYKPKDSKGRNRKNWYITFYCNGIRRRMAVSSNKKATEKIATAIDGILACHGSLTADLQLFVKGMNPKLRNKLLSFGVIRNEHVPKHAGKLLSEHVKDFGEALRAKGNDIKYANQIQTVVADIFDQCGFTLYENIDANHLYTYLADLRGIDGIGERTFNAYLKAAKQFCKWMISERRETSNPLQHLSCVTQTEKRRQRRALSLDEQRLLIETTAKGTEHHNMPGYGSGLIVPPSLTDRAQGQ